MKPLNLYKIQDWVNQGRLDPTKPITIKELCESRCVSNVKDGVKLLAKGSEEVKVPLNVIISRASAQAIAAIEAAGGSVTTRYYTPFAIKRIVQGKMDPVNSLQAQIPAGEYTAKRTFYNRLPDPTSRKDIEYYRDPAHRGYLSHLVPEGHGPSLFFKTPGAGRAIERKTTKAKNVASENRMW
ncbi:YmL10 [Lecanora helva]